MISLKLVFILLFICFLHFKILDFGFFAVTSGFVFCFLFFVSGIRHGLSKRDVFFVLFFWALPLINLYQVYYGYSLIEFFKSYLYWCFFVLFVHVARADSYISAKSYFGARDVFIALVFVVFFGVLQFVFAKAGAFGLYEIYSDRLLNYENSWWYRNSVWVSSGAGDIKATSFFYEPSFFGLIIVTLLFILLLINKYKLGAGFFSVLMIPIVGSASYVLGVLGLLGIWSVFNFGYKFKLLAFLFFGVVLTPIIVFLIGDRLAEISEEGASGYYRVVVPLKIFVHVIENHSFGLMLGGGDDLIRALGFWQNYDDGQVEKLTVDNGLILVAINFGLFTPLVFFYFGKIIVDRIVVHNDFIERRLLSMFYVFYVFLVTGAVFSFEIVSLFGLVFLASRFTVCKGCRIS